MLLLRLKPYLKAFIILLDPVGRLHCCFLTFPLQVSPKFVVVLQEKRLVAFYFVLEYFSIST
jgi:hypothetical protein